MGFSRQCLTRLAQESNFIKDTLEKVKEVVSQVNTPNGYFKRNWLLDTSFELQELVPDVDAAPLIIK